MKIETISEEKCALGEGPVWDARRKELYWIDIVAGKIFQYSFENKSLHTFLLDEMVGCLAVCKNDALIVATKSGIGFLNRDSGKFEHLINPEIHLPNNRFNDGKCDPMGRLWAGTMSISEEKEAGNLYVLENTTLEKKLEKISISNGLAWSKNHKTLYYIDTPTREVHAFRYDKHTAAIEDRKVCIKIPEEEGFPDGMTIDTEDHLWIAHWDGWRVSRWNPATGKKIFEIKLPVARITSCTFGGENFQDLFITSARIGLSEESLEKQPLAGSLFIIRNSGFQGLAAFEFNNER